MITINFNIKKYDWKVYLYIGIDENNDEEVFSKLSELRCKYSNVIEIYKTLSDNYLNKGCTYTNYNTHETIIMICKAESKSQYINTIVHEINHLTSHIANAYNIDDKNEELSYLIGNIAQIIYDEYIKTT